MSVAVPCPCGGSVLVPPMMAMIRLRVRCPDCDRTLIASPFTPAARGFPGPGVAPRPAGLEFPREVQAPPGP